MNYNGQVAALMEAYKAELKGIYDAREIAKKSENSTRKKSPDLLLYVAKYQIEGYKSQLNKLNEEAREIGKNTIPICSIYFTFGVDPDDEGNYRIPPDDNTAVPLLLKTNIIYQTYKLPSKSSLN